MHTGGGDKTLKSAIFTTFGPPWPWPQIESYGYNHYLYLRTKFRSNPKNYGGRTDIESDLLGRIEAQWSRPKNSVFTRWRHETMAQAGKNG